MIAYLSPPTVATPLNPKGPCIAHTETATRFRQSGPQVCGELIDIYRPRLYAFAYRLTGNHHDAEDIVQETFLRAFRGAMEFRGEAALSSWLYVIARNIARNRYRYWLRRKGDVTVSLDAPADGHDDARRGAVVADERSECEQHEIERCIAASIESLPQSDRIILQMRTRDHASYLDIGRSLGVGIGTVKSRLARARARLRASVIKACAGETIPMRLATRGNGHRGHRDEA